MGRKTNFDFEISSFRDSSELTQTLDADTPTARNMEDILPRASGNTRRLNPGHVLTLAESIAALGLIEPIVIDQDDRLIAGGHRIAAIRLLNANPKKRLEFFELICPKVHLSQPLLEQLGELADDGKIDIEAVPVIVQSFRSSEDPERALAIEAAENSKRRDYTAGEVKMLLERLKTAGYRTGRGRPKIGEKPAMPLLAVVVGKSRQHLYKILARVEKENCRTCDNFSLSREIRGLHRTLVRLTKQGTLDYKGAIDHIENAIESLQALTELSQE